MQKFRNDESLGRQKKPSLGCRVWYNLMDESRCWKDMQMEHRCQQQLGFLGEHASELELSVVYWGCATDEMRRSGWA